MSDGTRGGSSVAGERLARGQEQELVVERLAWGGAGVAREPSGRVVFVEGAFPGDRARVRLIQSKKGYARATVVELLERDFVAEDACPHAEYCGGCAFQGVPYERELAWKVDALRDTLSRIGRAVDWPAPTVVEAPRTSGYRERARFRLARGGGSGFLKTRSREVVALDSCPVVAPAIDELRPTVDKVLASIPAVHGYYVEHDPLTQRVLVTVRTGSDAEMRGVGDALAARVAEHSLPAQLGFAVAYRDRYAPIVGPQRREQQIGERTLEIEGGQFSQANFELNSRLVQIVVEAVAELGARHCVDLFCGYGNLTFPLAERGFEVTGCELPGLALEAARVTAEAMPEGAPRFGGADLSEAPAGEVASVLNGADVVVVDPPRGGLSDVLTQYLVDVGAMKGCVYVSCDPPALARDVGRLVQGGFSVKALFVVDMFPRTSHLEVVAVLSRG